MRSRIRAGDVPDLIRKTAEEFAGEFYDGDRTPQFRLQGTEYGLSAKAYVRRYWSNFVDIAVQVLSHMLQSPGLPEKQKSEIYEAIVDWNNRQTLSQRPPISMRSLN